MAFWSTIPILLALQLGVSSGNDYCSIECPPGTTHTMCLKDNKADCGKTFKLKEFSAKDKEDIVALHNNLRDKVAAGKEGQGTNGGQPPAADMMRLVWDDELAMIGKAWISKCKYEHDKCRNTKDGKYAGQNLAIGASTDSEIPMQKMVQDWYDEVQLFNKNELNKFTLSHATGHYTQVVWANTRKVGCAMITFDYEPYASYGDSQYLVCNYSPGGNMRAANIYTQGASCSKCPEKTSCDKKYTSLCSGSYVTDANRSDGTQVQIKKGLLMLSIVCLNVFIPLW